MATERGNLTYPENDTEAPTSKTAAVEIEKQAPISKTAAVKNDKHAPTSKAATVKNGETTEISENAGAPNKQSVAPLTPYKRFKHGMTALASTEEKVALCCDALNVALEEYLDQDTAARLRILMALTKKFIALDRLPLFVDYLVGVLDRLVPVQDEKDLRNVIDLLAIISETLSAAKNHGLATAPSHFMDLIGQIVTGIATGHDLKPAISPNRYFRALRIMALWLVDRQFHEGTITAWVREIGFNIDVGKWNTTMGPLLGTPFPLPAIHGHISYPWWTQPAGSQVEASMLSANRALHPATIKPKFLRNSHLTLSQAQMVLDFLVNVDLLKSGKATADNPSGGNNVFCVTRDDQGRINKKAKNTGEETTICNEYGWSLGMAKDMSEGRLPKNIAPVLPHPIPQGPRPVIPHGPAAGWQHGYQSHGNQNRGGGSSSGYYDNRGGNSNRAYTNDNRGGGAASAYNSDNRGGASGSGYSYSNNRGGNSNRAYGNDNRGGGSAYTYTNDNRGRGSASGYNESGRGNSGGSGYQARGGGYSGGVPSNNPNFNSNSNNYGGNGYQARGGGYGGGVPGNNTNSNNYGGNGYQARGGGYGGGAYGNNANSYNNGGSGYHPRGRGQW